MELRDIEYFAALAEHRHFGRAAAALGISQPALSKSLQRLEEALEVKLVQRTARGMTLTAEGSALRLRVHELQLSLRSVSREIKDIGEGRVGKLRIGAGAAISEDFLTAAFARLRRGAPRTELSVIVSDNDMMVPALSKGELDLVVNYNVNSNPAIGADGIRYEHLYDDEYVVCAADRHRLARHKQISLSDLVDEQWALSEPNLLAQQKLREAFRDAGLPPPRAGLECRSTTLRLRSVATSDLLDFTSRSVARRFSSAEIAILPVKALAWRRSVGLLRRDDRYQPPSLSAW